MREELVCIPEPCAVILSAAKDLQSVSLRVNSANHLLYPADKREMQILRCAQDDSDQGSFRNLREPHIAKVVRRSDT